MKIGLPRRREEGYAVVLMIGLISLLLVVMLANTQNTRNLGRELNHLDAKQAQRWHHLGASTNDIMTPKP